ncbi:MAG TPA: YvcK family protein [Candidatus Goldiibacteriota bacterium]|nr:YvcK family protein [Candidatus Goldiibacteriota bacterium]
MSRFDKWLYPGIRIKRWVFLLILSLIVLAVGLSGHLGSLVRNFRIETGINFDAFFYRLQRLKFVDVAIILLAIAGVSMAIRRAYYSVLAMYVPNREKEFINMAYRKAKLRRGPRIVAIGGGTGLPNSLRALKKYTSNLTAIVTVADDGGSSGRLRKDYQIIPPGDIRNCIVALADQETLLGKLFQYRFDKGEDLAGHSFGNIFITAMTHVAGDFSKGVEESSKVLAINGKVLPVSFDNMVLKARMQDGREITGESIIPEAKGVIERLSIIPEDCKANQDALEEIKKADVLVMGPGSLYTSVIPNLLVKGIKEAILANKKAAKIYVCNIMTQPGETDNFTVSDHIKAIFKHTGAKIFDYVVANNKEAHQDILTRYARENSYPVRIDREEISRLGVRVVEGKLFNDGDYIRHSEELLGRLVMKLLII